MKRLLVHLLIGVTAAAACSKASPVTPATLQSLALSGAAALANKSQTSQLTLIAMMSDGTAQNVTASAAWTSSSTAVASVSGAGVATAITNGSTTITATYQGKSATLSLTVAMKATPAMTPITIMMFDIKHVTRYINGFPPSDIIAAVGTNHLNAGESRVFSMVTIYTGTLDTADSTASVTMAVTDDAGNKSTLTEASIIQHDRC